MDSTVLMMPPPGRRDLLEGGARQTGLVLIGPVGRPGYVGVALHQARHDQAALGLDLVAARAPSCTCSCRAEVSPTHTMLPSWAAMAPSSILPKLGTSPRLGAGAGAGEQLSCSADDQIGFYEALLSAFTRVSRSLDTLMFPAATAANPSWSALPPGRRPPCAGARS